MKQSPILFKAEMVRAILDGSKTQTRRIVKERNYPIAFSGFTDEFVMSPKNHLYQSLYGTMGDQLWVRETFGIADNWIHESEIDPPRTIAYKADLSAINFDPFYKVNTSNWGWVNMKWKPSIFMPRWASRIQLEITDIRIERLNDISEADATKEFICSGYIPAVDEYKELWESINGIGSWALNPFVWVIEFKVIKNV